MSSVKSQNPSPLSSPRQRLTRDARHRQLLDVSWQLISQEGTEALTLGRLAEQSGVTKPVVYDHFGTRPGLLAALFMEFDARQTAIMDAALDRAASSLIDVAKVISSSYVDCVLTQGREIPGIIAALKGAPELEKIKHDFEAVFIEKCRKLLNPFSGPEGTPSAGLWGMLGAAEGLSNAAVNGDITPAQAKNELYEIIISMVERSLRKS
ncbi:TetR/AcrR family transcriptional regulator [Phyllobacterium sp. YR531]|uniref:TetR/AcrR family transcriptional regulator n=1 Tax=Phyllobacterium sp. YR531 TaxID=1144343 RepID=UPI00026FC367|nr:TetR/AcrR family transcriptional regulator [Phyllobacterium sp. YR531]EJN04868.1 transcriptional regulator [Phyllobacterium sp. YR531]